MHQEKLMLYDPSTGRPTPYPSHANQWRLYHGNVAWLYNPWNGKKRNPLDIGSDMFGFLIRDSFTRDEILLRSYNYVQTFQ